MVLTLGGSLYFFVGRDFFPTIDGGQIVKGLCGTLTVLFDCGFDDSEALRWLFVEAHYLRDPVSAVWFHRFFMPLVGGPSDESVAVKGETDLARPLKLLETRLAAIDAEGKAEALPPEALASMLERLAHRGPDGQGQFRSEFQHRLPYEAAPGVALGHRRLAIIDLATGAQPLANGGKLGELEKLVDQALEMLGEAEKVPDVYRKK